MGGINQTNSSSYSRYPGAVAKSVTLSPILGGKEMMKVTKPNRAQRRATARLLAKAPPKP